jgi:hypothetical protein
MKDASDSGDGKRATILSAWRTSIFGHHLIATTKTVMSTGRILPNKPFLYGKAKKKSLILG